MNRPHKIGEAASIYFAEKNYKKNVCGIKLVHYELFSATLS